MSFQTSIPHRPGQVRCTFQWSLSGHQHVCRSYTQENIKGQLKKTWNERCFQLNQYLSYKPHSSFFVFQMIFLTLIKTSKLVLGPHSKDRKYSSDKANIGNPKVNRVNSGCPPLTANRIWTDCDQTSPGPSIQYIPLGVYQTGGFNAMVSFTQPLKLSNGLTVNAVKINKIKALLEFQSLVTVSL